MQPAQYGTTPCDRGAKYDPEDEQQVQPQDRSCQGGIHAISSYAALFCAALHFAHRALFAALIRARPVADIVRLPVFIVLLVLAFAEFSAQFGPARLLRQRNFPSRRRGQGSTWPARFTSWERSPIRSRERRQGCDSLIQPISFLLKLLHHLGDIRHQIPLKSVVIDGL